MWRWLEDPIFERQRIFIPPIITDQKKPVPLNSRIKEILQIYMYIYVCVYILKTEKRKSSLMRKIGIILNSSNLKFKKHNKNSLEYKLLRD